MKYWKLINGIAVFAAFLWTCTANAPNTAALIHAEAKASKASKASETPETEINAAIFPDKNFREIVVKQADADGDGKLSQEEIRNVTKLDIQYPHKESHPWYGASLSDLYDYPDLEHPYDGVTMDLTGLEQFENLQQLRLHNMKPENLPLARLEKLSFLEISSAPEMELDVSGAPGLTELAVAQTSFTGIRLDQNTKLQHLRLYHVSAPESVLDLTELTELASVTVEGSDLAGIELGEKPDLTELLAGCGLKEIDLSGCPNLERARLDGNGLKTVDVSRNPKLIWLYLKDNLLTKLDLRQNPGLDVLDISGNAFTKINSSTVRTGKGSVLSFLCAGNLAKCTLLDVSHLGGLSEVQAPHSAFTKVKIAKNLTTLDISASKLTALDKKTLQAPSKAKLEQLHCSSGKLKKINASHLKNLRQIAAGSNRLTDVNVSGCVKMESCYLDGNPLKKLTVSSKSGSRQRKQYQKTVKENGGRLFYK